MKEKSQKMIKLNKFSISPYSQVVIAGLLLLLFFVGNANGEIPENCDCVEINGTRYNSSQMEFITTGLLKKIEELEHPIKNSSCRMIVNVLNSKIRQLNQTADTKIAELIHTKKQLKLQRILSTLSLIVISLWYLSKFEEKWKKKK